MLALATPFTSGSIQVARRNRATWNPYLHSWQIPVRSLQLPEFWELIEEAYYECDWGFDIDVVWNLSLNDRQEQILKKRIASLQSEDAIAPSPQVIKLEATELIRLACQHFRDVNKSATWQPDPDKTNTRTLHCLCVNYLRHRATTGYDKRLGSVDNSATYLTLFEETNQAIAQAYPWLETECQRQIRQRREEHG